MTKKMDDSDLSKVTGGTDLQQNPPSEDFDSADSVVKPIESGGQPGPTSTTGGTGTPDMGQNP